MGSRDCWANTADWSRMACGLLLPTKEVTSVVSPFLYAVAAISATLLRCSSNAASSDLLDLFVASSFFLAILSCSFTWLYFSTSWSTSSLSLLIFFWTSDAFGLGAAACATTGGKAKEVAAARQAAAASREA